MLTFLAFLGVFGLLVLVHEMGHFTVAKLAGVRVLEFGMGFPPKLLRFRKGETLYTLNAIPLGGFVKMAGEEDPSESRSLAGKPIPVRALVISAGALMNIVLALVLFAVVFMVPKDMYIGDVRVTQVGENSPASAAGVLPGDIFRKVNGQQIESLHDLSAQFRLRTGAAASVELERNGQPVKTSIVPRWKPPSGQGATGVVIEIANGHVVSSSKSFFPAFGAAARQLVETMVLMKNEVTSWFVGTSEPEFAGPIGIAQMTGEVAGLGFLPLLDLAALLSLNLGILNILPLPALDGGRLFFILVEVLRRGKRIPAKKEALVHLGGFVLLITTVLIISYFDILRIVRGDSLLGG